MHMTWGFVVAAVIQKVWIRPGAWRLTRIFAGDKVPPRVPYGAFVLVRLREERIEAKRRLRPARGGRGAFGWVARGSVAPSRPARSNAH